MAESSSANELVLKSRRVVFQDVIRPAAIYIRNGLIARIEDNLEAVNQDNVLDVGDLVVMAGLVDSHVHVNDPGRSHWEGFPTATRAAAAGGVTTIVDMPLNSLPPTTTPANFAEKLQAAKDHISVDVAFWGGIIPGNQGELKPLLDMGIRGFKCFMCPSGVDEFPHVCQTDLHQAFQALHNTDAKILFHAEVDLGCVPKIPQLDGSSYDCFLQSRPGLMETQAIELVIELCDQYRVACHIVHLSCADSIAMIAEAKSRGVPLTVETCPHYLTLSSENVPVKATQFKCCPPIRCKSNQHKLWQAVLDKTIDLVVSDHSPAPQDLKCTDSGDFMRAWGGISSLQLVLPLLWTFGQTKGLTLNDLTRLLSVNTAKLAGLDKRKGSIQVGKDADFVIWSPEEQVLVTPELLHFRHKLSPYLGNVLNGTVHKTILRGSIIFDDNQFPLNGAGIVLVEH